jgi:quercetin dioxygenase-like cupin family protein
MIEDSMVSTVGRRDVVRTATAYIVAAAAVGAVHAGPAAVPTRAKSPARAGIRAIKLYTGADHASHVLEGVIDEAARTDVIAMRFEESPAHSSEAWHDSPEWQYVITLSGTLEFTTRGGETFVLRPGDVLLSEDKAGTGHRWRLIDDQPWRRAYVVLKPGARDSFVPMAGV